MKILFIDSNHPVLHETLQKAGHTCDLNYLWTKDEIINNIQLYDGLVIRSKIKITKEIIDKATRLKFIARAGAGMEILMCPTPKAKIFAVCMLPKGIEMLLANIL